MDELEKQDELKHLREQASAAAHLSLIVERQAKEIEQLEARLRDFVDKMLIEHARAERMAVAIQTLISWHLDEDAPVEKLDTIIDTLRAAVNDWDGKPCPQ